MVELKTLLNLQTELTSNMYANKPTVYVTRLRKEAINWIKEISKKHPEFIIYPYDLQISINWIKHFFNLTEEDLR